MINLDDDVVAVLQAYADKHKRTLGQVITEVLTAHAKFLVVQNQEVTIPTDTVRIPRPIQEPPYPPRTGNGL